MNTALLLSMPFGPLERQALGLSVLKPQLERRGIACSIRYLTFPFAEFIGYENYHWISNTVPYTAFAGDWVFRRALYGRHDHEEHAYVQDILRQTWKLGEEDIDRIFHIRAFVEPFMEYCVQRFQWGEYCLVGLTSTFEQNLASLALAKRLKTLFPHLAIVFGGANWEGEMGRELMRQFPFVDFVCSGEADDSFPALAHALFHAPPAGRRLSSIGGLVWREGEEIRHTGQAPLIRHMDALPVPDYEDYFDNLEDSTVSASVVPVLLLETSRGCWWGEKAHCTFCGLNGGAMEFRSKSAARSLRELESLSSRWQIDFIEVVDNIMDMKAFQEFLPTLAQQGAPYRLFYEVKSNLTKAHVRVLAAAGVFRIQPGIESMNDHVLHLMRKGTTALRNIQLLKWCKEYGITVDWNILYGFPGETAQDYQSMLSLLPAIRFLGAPTACGPIRLDRFSPYFNDPEQFGLTNVQANPVYRHLYPFPQDRLNRIAYFFDYEYRTGLPADEYAHELIRYCDEWRQQPESGCVWSLACEPGELVLLDTRTNAAQTEFRLSGMEAEAYRYCDDLRREQAIFRHLREHFPGTNFSGQDVRRFLQSLCACGLMVTDGDHYLSLAIPYPPSGTPSCPAWVEDDGHRSAIQGDSLRSRHELPMVAFTPSNGG